MHSPASARSIQFLNLHFGLKQSAETLGWTFSSIYFYKLGIPIPAIFLIWALFFLIRFFTRPIYLKFIFNKNLKTILIVATIMYTLAFPMLALVKGLSVWLYIFVPFYALVSTIYWLIYHTYFAVVGNVARRGKEVFSREVLVGLGSIAAPLFGGLLIAEYSFTAAWLVATLVTLISAVPLVYAQNITLSKPFGFVKALRSIDRIGLWSYLAQGFYENGISFAWGLVLFLMFGNIALFGLLITVAIFFKVVMYYVLGNYLDQGQKTPRALWLGAMLVTAGVIGRVFFAYSISAVIALDALLTAAVAFIYPVLDIMTYNASKDSQNPLWFQFFAESGWDIGVIFVFTLIALFTYFGGGLRHAMLLSIFGIIFLVIVLGSYQKIRLRSAPVRP